MIRVILLALLLTGCASRQEIVESFEYGWNYAPQVWGWQLKKSDYYIGNGRYYYRVTETFGPYGELKCWEKAVALNIANQNKAPYHICEYKVPKPRWSK